MTLRLDSREPDLQTVLRPGDGVLWGNATGEPTTLTEALVRQRERLGPLEVFLGSGFSDTLAPEHADHLRFTGIGGIGTMRRLTKAGVVAVIPCHLSQVAPYLQQGLIRTDVVFVQLSPPGPDGRHSYGVSHDYIHQAVTRARLVVAEINDRVPWTKGDATIAPERIDFAIETSRPVVAVEPAPIGPVDRAIAGHIARYIEDGTTLQLGIGAVPDAILRSVGDRRDLGFHSGMMSDAVVDLIEQGALTNARKPIDPGLTVTGLLIGTERLYRFAHRNPDLAMRNSAYIQGEAVLASLPRLVAVNTAVEVDLGGQVNAEQAGQEYVGGIGGQSDFVRAGHRSTGGHAVIALPATAKGGTVSRIVWRLAGGVTSPRTDIDVVVTEFGAAELKAQPLPERARRLIAIAHPDHRDALDRAAYDLYRRGY